ncbi:hypothetical protein QTO34_007289 [Cnephaeus nilssonii]|uniref:Uncharacterized protein n=1 Tax=Cnephaeus nilssonii TaxID=3371016 RepID=A0AA40HJY5_CNENI|nr:hypothetical protein QTO34_007289 [Eptesicus nilssonii]
MPPGQHGSVVERRPMNQEVMVQFPSHLSAFPHCPEAQSCWGNAECLLHHYGNDATPGAPGFPRSPGFAQKVIRKNFQKDAPWQINWKIANEAFAGRVGMLNTLSGPVLLLTSAGAGLYHINRPECSSEMLLPHYCLAVMLKTDRKRPRSQVLSYQLAPASKQELTRVKVATGVTESNNELFTEKFDMEFHYLPIIPDTQADNWGQEEGISTPSRGQRLAMPPIKDQACDTSEVNIRNQRGRRNRFTSCPCKAREACRVAFPLGGFMLQPP